MLNCDRSTVKHALQNTQNDCYQWLSNSFRVHVFGATEVKKSKIHLKICDVEIQQVDCSKYLGIFIDSKLSWQTHID